MSFTIPVYIHCKSYTYGNSKVLLSHIECESCVAMSIGLWVGEKYEIPIYGITRYRLKLILTLSKAW